MKCVLNNTTQIITANTISGIGTTEQIHYIMLWSGTILWEKVLAIMKYKHIQINKRHIFAPFQKLWLAFYGFLAGCYRDEARTKKKIREEAKMNARSSKIGLEKRTGSYISNFCMNTDFLQKSKCSFFLELSILCYFHMYRWKKDVINNSWIIPHSRLWIERKLTDTTPLSGSLNFSGSLRRKRWTLGRRVFFLTCWQEYCIHFFRNAILYGYGISTVSKISHRIIEKLCKGVISKVNHEFHYYFTATSIFMPKLTFSSNFLQ